MAGGMNEAWMVVPVGDRNERSHYTILLTFAYFPIFP